MEWNSKWGCESPKKPQLTDLGFVDEAELDTGSFYLLGGGGAGSGSVYGGSSAKSSLSASTNSEGTKSSNFASGRFPGDLDRKTERSRVDVSGNSPPLGSIEPFIGLKLGKRTYFESSASVKKAKSSSRCAPTPPFCQVEGCNLDLSSAKDYHRKHRVCDSHSKCPKVVVGGVERRFCQQCSRFHSLSEFDEKKRSCRRRLSDHNTRRRKPLQDPTQFNSTSMLPSFHDGRQQMNFVLNHCPLFPSRTAVDSTWESTCTSKFTVTRGFTSKPEKAISTSKPLNMAGIQLPNAVGASKGTTIAEVFNQGAKQSSFPSNTGTKLEVPRALSLLSSTSWGGLNQPELISLDNPLPANQTSTTLGPFMHNAIPPGLLVSSPEYLQQPEQNWTDFGGHLLPGIANTTGGVHLSQVQLFKVPHDTDFYYNALN